MQTAADVFRALNSLLLDFGPFVALAALAGFWWTGRRRYREEEKRLKERIEEYRIHYEAPENGEVRHEETEGLHQEIF